MELRNSSAESRGIPEGLLSNMSGSVTGKRHFNLCRSLRISSYITDPGATLGQTYNRLNRVNNVICLDMEEKQIMSQRKFFNFTPQCSDMHVDSR